MNKKEDSPLSGDPKRRVYVLAKSYRKSGKTLVTLYPASKSLTVLVVLGKKEVAKVEQFENKLAKKFAIYFIM